MTICNLVGGHGSLNMQICQFQGGARVSLGEANAPPRPPPERNPGVCFPYSGTSRNQAYKQQYQRLQRDTGMKYKKGFFFKMLRSEVMASFTHPE